MYWRCGAWKPVKDDDARSVVNELGKQLAEAEGRLQTSLLRYDTQATSEMGQYPPSDETLLISTSSKITTEPGQKPPTGAFQCRQVREVKYRKLPFYSDHDWRLYRFTCPIDPDKSDELAGYLSEAAFFAVRGPEGGISRWTILDWTSAPLHRLNKMAYLDFETSGKRVDYLLFFVSYLGSSEGRYGLIHPFVIPDSPREIFDPVRESNKWAPSAMDETSSPHLPFDEFAESKELILFKVEDFAHDLPADIDRRIDPFDIPEQPQPNPPRHAVERDQSVRKIVEDFFQKGSFDEISLSQGNGERPLFKLKVPMTYRSALFETTLSGYGNGLILMEDYEPVPGADWLPAPRWEVQRRPDGIPLLCLQQPRRELEIREMLAKFSGKPIVNVRIKGQIDKPDTIKNPLLFRDVEFTDDVVFDDWIFERSLVFKECRFMRGLSLHNATVNGSLTLDRSEIHGAVEKSPWKSQKLVKHSLDLRGLKVDRLLSLDRLRVYGQLDGKGLRAANAVHGRGLQVSLRQNIDDPDRPALDISYASISGPLLLEAHDDSKSDPLDPFRRTIVSGAVSLTGLSAQEIKVNGMVVGRGLDCQFSNISGGIWVKPYHCMAINWRTFIFRLLNFSHARVGILYLDGSHIDSSILMIEMRARSVYARGHSVSWQKDRFGSGLYRCWIKGSFEASGATIDNVVEMEGTLVDGELNFITGRCGRLNLSVHPWWEGKEAPRLTVCEAQGLTLLSFTIDRNISCVGLCLRTPSGTLSTWSEGGVFTQGLRIDGSLLFWRPNQPSSSNQEASQAL